MYEPHLLHSQQLGAGNCKKKYTHSHRTATPSHSVFSVSSPSLAVEELLDDGDDDSLGLGLGDKFYAGARLSGEIMILYSCAFTPPLALI